MKLIENVGQAARLWSVQVSAAGAAIAGVWSTIPEPQQQAIIAALPVSPSVAAMLGFIAAAVARVMKQQGLTDGRSGGSGDD